MLSIKTEMQNIELQLLGALMLDTQKADWFFGKAKEEYFTNSPLRKIFLSLKHIYESNPQNPSLLSSLPFVYQVIQHLGFEDVVQSRVDLADIMQSVATSATMEYHLGLVIESYLKNQMLNLALEIRNLSLEPITSPQEIKNHWEAMMDKLFLSEKESGFEAIGDILPRVLEQIEKIRAGEVPDWLVHSGFADLDNLIGGFHQGDFILLAGRPSMGKTSLALNIATNVACSGKPVGFVTIESSDLSLAERFLSGFLKIDNTKFSTGRISKEELDNLRENLDLAKLPIFVDYPINPEISELKSAARELKAIQKISFLIIDYLQLIRVDRNFESKQVMVAYISAQLKGLAKELKIPILVCSQLSRKVEEREDREPELSDLRESGALEQDADLVLMLWRPEFYAKSKPEEKSLAKFKIAKNRNGIANKIIELTFLAEYTKFENHRKE